MGGPWAIQPAFEFATRTRRRFTPARTSFVMSNSYGRHAASPAFWSLIHTSAASPTLPRSSSNRSPAGSSFSVNVVVYSAVPE